MTQRRTLQETTTALAPADVLDAAKEFFARRNNIYSAFVEQESAHHVTLRGQGGEEIAINAMTRDGATLVTASTYMFDAQVSRFFSILPHASAAVPAPEVVA
ncbi:MAG: hypothetical protein ABIZ91_12190 [Gemmatimonadaceae bacterium]